MFGLEENELLNKMKKNFDNEKKEKEREKNKNLYKKRKLKREKALDEYSDVKEHFLKVENEEVYDKEFEKIKRYEEKLKAEKTKAKSFKKKSDEDILNLESSEFEKYFLDK